MSTIPFYLLLSRHSVYYFRIVVSDVIRPLFPQTEIRRSLQTLCKREALIRGRDILAQGQGLFTQRRQHDHDHQRDDLQQLREEPDDLLSFAVSGITAGKAGILPLAVVSPGLFLLRCQRGCSVLEYSGRSER